METKFKAITQVPGQCDRCDKPGITYRGSIFNTEMICMDCQALERAHPQYNIACIAERDAVRGGQYNFPGIGLPDDLKPRSHSNENTNRR